MCTCIYINTGSTLRAFARRWRSTTKSWSTLSPSSRPNSSIFSRRSTRFSNSATSSSLFLKNVRTPCLFYFLPFIFRGEPVFNFRDELTPLLEKWKHNSYFFSSHNFLGKVLKCRNNFTLSTCEWSIFSKSRTRISNSATSSSPCLANVRNPSLFHFISFYFEHLFKGESVFKIALQAEASSSWKM